jgi:hypothetical protein
MSSSLFIIANTAQYIQEKWLHSQKKKENKQTKNPE